MRWMMALALLLAVEVGLAAEPLDWGPQECKTLKRPEARLACYDTVFGPDPATSEDDGAPSDASALAKRWELTSQTERGPFVITPYRPTYLLPLSYNARPNRDTSSVEDLERTEIKFQLSFKTKIWPGLLSQRGDLWFAFTQQSFWQAYSDSAPFRETNFEPELIYAWNTNLDVFGLRARVLTFGLNHQSNGRSDPLSRSWNRLTAGVLFDEHDFALDVRGWWRIPESRANDDNPDIEDFVGRGQLRGFYKDGEHIYALLLRSNFDPADVRGAVRFDYSFPLGWGPLKGYLQLFHGYGESLIDYNHISSRISVGIMLVDWL